MKRKCLSCAADQEPTGPVSEAEVAAVDDEKKPAPVITDQAKAGQGAAPVALSAPAAEETKAESIAQAATRKSVAGKSKLDVKAENLTERSEVVVLDADAVVADKAPVIVKATPEGGLTAYDRYLENDMRYPPDALRNKVKGNVVVEFTVEADGRIANFKVLESIGQGCDEEVIRLIKEGPAWLAGKQNNQPVESQVRVTVNFDPAKTRK